MQAIKDIKAVGTNIFKLNMSVQFTTLNLLVCHIYKMISVIAVDVYTFISAQMRDHYNTKTARVCVQFDHL